MKTIECCGKKITGKPYVLISYWCEGCKTEHLHDAVEMTEYIARLHAEKDAASGGLLPNIL